MISPLINRELKHFTSIDSTQRFAKDCVMTGRYIIGAVVADQQTEGRGRLGRSWHSPPGASLSVSFVLWEYADWPKPELIGMACGLAAAITFNCQVAWPNDLMLRGKKVGGVLTELQRDPAGRLVPIVGIGANLGRFDLPEEFAHSAGFLEIEITVEDAAMRIAKSFQIIPEPASWGAVSDHWSRRDATTGKEYKLPTGEIATAIGISDSGELIASTGDRQVTVPSAEAWFGRPD
ncbi:MAG: biotin--[acetyl-CoA-carboxylase] ligase [Fimbriimonadales bacterium]